MEGFFPSFLWSFYISPTCLKQGQETLQTVFLFLILALSLVVVVVLACVCGSIYMGENVSVKLLVIGWRWLALRCNYRPTALLFDGLLVLICPGDELTDWSLGGTQSLGHCRHYTSHRSRWRA